MSVTTGKLDADLKGIPALRVYFLQNRKLYFQEALGLAVFMFSACFFGSILESAQSPLAVAIDNALARTVIMGMMMGGTALFIFYAPFTSVSGSHINPAVTLSFWRLGKMNHRDAFFYILFQFIGGTLAVFIMAALLGALLAHPPVRFVITVPGHGGRWAALTMEFLIAFITMSMVLYTSSHEKWKRYTRILSAILVCIWVIVAGPVSGFGMNPARSFASAFVAQQWTAFWIYAVMPVAGMLVATEFFIYAQLKKRNTSNT